MVPKTTTQPTNTEIARYAYLIWEREGCPPGRDVTHWLEAEKQLKANPLRNNVTRHPAPAVERGISSARPKRSKQLKALTV